VPVRISKDGAAIRGVGLESKKMLTGVVVTDLGAAHRAFGVPGRVAIAVVIPIPGLSLTEPRRRRLTMARRL